MSRPAGPKKQAALEQLAKMREAKLPESEIRQALLEAGLSGVQVREIMPTPEPSKPMTRPLEPEAKAAITEGAIHFLNTIAQRLTPDACNRYPDLVAIKNDALTWGRKLKGAL